MLIAKSLINAIALITIVLAPNSVLAQQRYSDKASDNFLQQMNKYVTEPLRSQIPDYEKLADAHKICETLESGATEKELSIQIVQGKYWRAYGNDASDYTSPLQVFAVENFCPHFGKKD